MPVISLQIRNFLVLVRAPFLMEVQSDADSEASSFRLPVRAFR